MIADQIKQAVTKYWNKKLWVVHSEVGVCKHGRLRADLLATSMGSHLVIVEVKSSVADFRTDKKVLNYIPFCDRLYFAFSDLVYAKVKHLIPKGVGVFVVNSKTFNVRIKVRATWHEVEAKTRLNVVTRLAYRSGTTLYERKSKTSGAKLVALTAVEAIQAMPREARKGHKQAVVAAVAQAISKYV